MVDCFVFLHNFITIICVADELTHLQKKVSELELKEQEILKAKEESEKEFGQKRAKFKELFMQKEGKSQKM